VRCILKQNKQNNQIYKRQTSKQFDRLHLRFFASIFVHSADVCLSAQHNENVLCWPKNTNGSNELDLQKGKEKKTRNSK
jgi:hypothetical protein